MAVSNDMPVRLCIDPGHGMSNRVQGKYDPGACAHGLAEADIALQWALTGKWVMNQAGIFVYLTRDDDRDHTPVGSRDDMAERQNCSHFISIHCNAGGGTGCETYYRDDADKVLAQLVQRSLLHATGLKDRGLKLEGESQHSRLAVLDFAGPGCLAETGFIDRAHDAKKLVDRDVRIRFWESVRDGLLR